MELVIISGRSGSGKSTALHQLEDEGYYCIDNLPIGLLPALVNETNRSEFAHFRGAAVCIDARNAWKDLQNFNAILASLPEEINSQILFLDAQDSALIKRFSETRRKHPLSSSSTPLAEAIERERVLLESIASAATLVLDTTQLTIYELRDAIKQRLLGSNDGSMSLLIQSFGFKRGVPIDADLVFDVRVLPNPHWVAELRMQSGLDQPVQDFLNAQPMTSELFDSISSYLDLWLPQYAKSNRSYMTVSIGCTGGQHRSVYFSERLFQRYQHLFPQVHLRHRELQQHKP
ncbi:RNase adapter RapZ [Parahaliea sp. F7430]|uniref:RNase adapter RapZ n=1 Tax=Sediminihaliea albiluteola TaxID=2758564 RepID=A0A7W2YK60_9GAMM|nr:RNase adapter RapZ [Sediminihaliea albiluteola]MBA6412998.1 RNase adapter RapZ [Sediminihaliea albiluteola]